MFRHHRAVRHHRTGRRRARIQVQHQPVIRAGRRLQHKTFQAAVGFDLGRQLQMIALLSVRHAVEKAVRCRVGKAARQPAAAEIDQQLVARLGHLIVQWTGGIDDHSRVLGTGPDASALQIGRMNRTQRGGRGDCDDDSTKAVQVSPHKPH
jgi:hypothetical protein